ncbi:MAG: amino acid adenylation protein, partial [Myxococcales bacterium]|nr:amino acid adenylation protein [Myxococcales bacterium]
ALASQPRFAPDVELRGEQAAYVLYTSGSTGAPKGVVVPHRALAHLVDSAARRYQLDAGDRVLQLSSLGFDVAAEEIFPTLAAGGAIVPWTKSDPASAADLSAFVDRNQISVVNLPAPLWHDWVASLSESPSPLPPSLRLVVVGGDEVSPASLRDWRRAYPSAPAWLHAYGVIEATVTSTVDDGATLSPDAARVLIGRPLDGVTALVLDAAGDPALAGQVGELHLGGLGVARGYLDRPGLTAERFVPDRFAARPGARLYRTGDRARLLPDGALELLGRDDQQVKLAGHRVELGEVEAALLSHPSVDDVAVTVCRDGEPSLCAYVVANEDDDPLDGEALRSFLAERLPGYMLPRIFVPVASLPLAEEMLEGAA